MVADCTPPDPLDEPPPDPLDEPPVDPPIDWPLDQPLPEADTGAASNPDHPHSAQGSSCDGGCGCVLDPDPLERMDAFARRVGFTPTRLPTWLEPRPADRPADRATGAGQDPRDPGDDPPPPPPPRQSQQPTFEFDWSRLLPSLTLHLHLSTDDLTARHGGVARWEGEGPVTHQFVHDHLRPLHRYRINPSSTPPP